MAIRIQTQDTFIPVEIGEVELKFKADDDSLNKIINAVDDFNERAEALETKVRSEELSYDAEFEATKELLKDSFDYLLGDGAFDKIYNQTPSLKLVLNYFLEISEGLKKELEERGIDTEQNEKMKKYLKDNKPKTKKNK